MIGRIIFCPWSFYAPTSSTYPPLISTQSWQRWSMSCMFLSHHNQIIAQTSINSCQICPNVIVRITRRSCKHLVVQISTKEIITWHEMWQSLQPHHCIVWQWGFYLIHKTCKKWKWHCHLQWQCTRSCVTYDARRVPMERGWVALYLYATCRYSNQLILEQWAFENGLPFLYAL